LGDESLIIIADSVYLSDNVPLEFLNVSSSRISDHGVLHFLEHIDKFQHLKRIRLADNFISEKIEKILLEILFKNKTLIEFAV